MTPLKIYVSKSVVSHLHEVSIIVKFRKTESRTVVTRNLGKGGIGRYYLMGRF